MKRLKACVVGMGFIGVVHVEALRRLGYVDVVAIATGTDAPGKAAAHQVPRGYADYREMIERERPDVVHVCTPNSTHFDIAMAAMEHGASVVCEKPLTATAEQARLLCEYAQERGIVNAVNFNFRFYPQVMQMREMVRSGEVGDIYTVHGGYLQDWLYFDTDYSWRLEPELSGQSRVFADIGSHWIDLVETVTGQRAVEVFAEFSTFHKTRKKPRKPVETFSGTALRPEDYQEIPIDTEDCATVLFRFDGGARGCCNLSQMYAGRKNQTTVSIGGSKCSLHWDSEKGNELWVGRREAYNQQVVKDPALLHEEARRINAYPGGHVEGFADTFKHCFADIYAAIRDGDTGARNFARFHDGLREMILCEQVIRSAREGRWMAVGE